jgi:hypothetical protein
MARQHHYHALAICTGENVERELCNAGVEFLDQNTLAWRIATAHPLPAKICWLYTDDDAEVHRSVTTLLEERADGVFKRFVRSKTPHGRKVTIKFGLPLGAFKKPSSVVSIHRTG